MPMTNSSPIPPSSIPTPLVFAYYCSGHGYGHATRVSAFAAHLLSLNHPTTPSSSLPPPHRPYPKIKIHIVSSAPSHVFSTSLALGARYRHAFIDPVIVQPLAYSVDRDRSVAGLTEFLDESRFQEMLDREIRWLKDEIKADCVLSDAAFLGCLAAKSAGIPSILVTNFTFDSVYSYLSTTILQDSPSPDSTWDTPVSPSLLTPLISRLHTGYRHADLLVLLPGAIPIPSFTTHPGLPSTTWVNTDSLGSSPYGELNENVRSFLINIHEKATAAWSGDKGIQVDTEGVWPGLPYSSLCSELRSLEEGEYVPMRGGRTRGVVYAPLIVRPPSKHIPSSSSTMKEDGPAAEEQELDVYTPKGRSRFLSSIGIPERFHDQRKTKILAVSFGGQVVKRPKQRRRSRPSSSSRSSSYGSEEDGGCSDIDQSSSRSPTPTPVMTPVDENRRALSSPVIAAQDHGEVAEGLRGGLLDWHEADELEGRGLGSESPPHKLQSDLLFEPGSTRYAQHPSDDSQEDTKTRKDSIPKVDIVEGIQEHNKVVKIDDGDANQARLLPDETWIAIICGVDKEQWDARQGDDGDEGGEGDGDDDDDMNRFFVAPKDVYMPDLTAVADVLLGKLGYGTTSECVDACTPFVYVSRPLFVEEHGLKLLLQRGGVGVEMPRQSYEVGDWMRWVGKAWEMGRLQKEMKRREEGEGGGHGGGELPMTTATKGRLTRAEEGRRLGSFIVEWLSSHERASITG